MPEFNFISIGGITIDIDPKTNEITSVTDSHGNTWMKVPKTEESNESDIPRSHYEPELTDSRPADPPE